MALNAKGLWGNDLGEIWSILSLNTVEPLRQCPVADEEKLSEVPPVCREDPAWIIEQSKELKQTILYGQEISPSGL